jgi:hypothetical protein
MFNVQARAVDDAGVQRLAMEAVADSVTLPGSASRGAFYLVNPYASAHSLAARLALRDVAVEAIEDSLRVSGRTWPAGTWVIPGSAGEARVAAWARDHGFQAVGVGESALRGARRHALDEGWTRYALDRIGMPYAYVSEDRLRQGGLRERYDVILFPAQGSRSTGRAIFGGVDPRFGRLAYVRSDSFPSLGTPDSTQNVTGGMGFEGLAALRDFVDSGGTLITLGSASALPVEMGLVRDVSTTAPRSLFVPGSIVRGRVAQAANPVTYGYGGDIPLYHQFGPYLTLPDRVKGRAVLRYATAAGDVFMSGLVREARELADQAAAVVVPTGNGNVVLFGFDPLHRFQNHGNFALVWNALLNWNDLRVGLPPPGAPSTSASDDAHGIFHEGN